MYDEKHPSMLINKIMKCIYLATAAATLHSSQGGMGWKRAITHFGFASTHDKKMMKKNLFATKKGEIKAKESERE